MNRMRSIGVLAASALVVAGLALSVAAQQEKAKEKPKLGHKDTPMLPGGKWHVHDGDRPQPADVHREADSTQEAPGQAAFGRGRLVRRHRPVEVGQRRRQAGGVEDRGQAWSSRVLPRAGVGLIKTRTSSATASSTSSGLHLFLPGRRPGEATAGSDLQPVRDSGARWCREPDLPRRPGGDPGQPIPLVNASPCRASGQGHRLHRQRNWPQVR